MLDSGNIISLVFSIIAAALSIATFVVNWIRQRKINTIAAYIELQKSLSLLSKYPDDELKERTKNRSSDDYQNMTTCLVGIEIFATGVKEKVYDFYIVYPLAHGYLDGVLRKKIDYLLSIKNAKEPNKYYQSTVWLLSEMDKGPSKNFFQRLFRYR